MKRTERAVTKVWNVWWRKPEGSWEQWRKGGVLNRLDRVARVGTYGVSGQWPLTRGAAGTAGSLPREAGSRHPTLQAGQEVGASQEGSGSYSASFDSGS